MSFECFSNISDRSLIFRIRGRMKRISDDWRLKRSLTTGDWSDLWRLATEAISDDRRLKRSLTTGDWSDLWRPATEAISDDWRLKRYLVTEEISGDWHLQRLSGLKRSLAIFRFAEFGQYPGALKCFVDQNLSRGVTRRRTARELVKRACAMWLVMTDFYVYNKKPEQLYCFYILDALSRWLIGIRVIERPI